jgi:hypothetical protein
VMFVCLIFLLSVVMAEHKKPVAELQPQVLCGRRACYCG